MGLVKMELGGECVVREIMEVVVMEEAGGIEVVVVMKEATTEVVPVEVGLVKMEVGLVKMEVEMGFFKNLVVFVLGFSDISAWFLVSRIRRFLLE